MRIDYGQDAPGLMRGFLAGGVGAGVAAGLVLWFGPLPWLAVPLGLVALYLLIMGGFMVFESRVGKVANRDAILNRLSWRGDETVLDVGCGRGLMLIGAALRVPLGHATGIDLWRAKDQAGNSAEATLGNARLAGVADRVTVQTADMRELPFPDGRFDLILSAWAVHNLDDDAGQRAALAEMLRVLKPGGQLVVTDIAGRGRYPEILAHLGADAVEVAVHAPRKHKIMAALSFGSFAPFTLTARKGT